VRECRWIRFDYHTGEKYRVSWILSIIARTVAGTIVEKEIIKEIL